VETFISVPILSPSDEAQANASIGANFFRDLHFPLVALGQRAQLKRDEPQMLVTWEPEAGFSSSALAGMTSGTGSVRIAAR
jgi:hypothetical protein